MQPIRRLNRIFRADGRALIVAMDHGLLDGPCKGLERPGETIVKIAAGGADAVLTSYGIARRFAHELAPLGLILRADGTLTSLAKADALGKLFFGVEEALRLGAEALAVSGYPGSPREAESLRAIATLSGQAHEWGLAVLAEMVPGGFDSAPEFRTLDAISLAARVGAELGADLIKTPYVSGFERAINGCFAPVVILGGAKRGRERDMLVDIQAAVQAGAAGVAIGRNIFQAEDPTAMAASIAAILHDGASVDEAMEIITQPAR
jgi:class I fructose-bisphosphate aldolase/fructose-bisphosphate aldolase/2-amino-3,7-dideoxy-D-threo-hept-6-ulosonate synthase